MTWSGQAVAAVVGRRLSEGLGLAGTAYGGRISREATPVRLWFLPATLELPSG